MTIIIIMSQHRNPVLSLSLSPSFNPDHPSLLTGLLDWICVRTTQTQNQRLLVAVHQARALQTYINICSITDIEHFSKCMCIHTFKSVYLGSKLLFKQVFLKTMEHFIIFNLNFSRLLVIFLVSGSRW